MIIKICGIKNTDTLLCCENYEQGLHKESGTDGPAHLSDADCWGRVGFAGEALQAACRGDRGLPEHPAPSADRIESAAAPRFDGIGNVSA